MQISCTGKIFWNGLNFSIDKKYYYWQLAGLIKVHNRFMQHSYYNWTLLQANFISKLLVYYCMNSASCWLGNRVRYLWLKHITSHLWHPCHLLLNDFHWQHIVHPVAIHWSRSCSHQQDVMCKYLAYARYFACGWLVELTKIVIELTWTVVYFLVPIYDSIHYSTPVGYV